VRNFPAGPPSSGLPERGRREQAPLKRYQRVAFRPPRIASPFITRRFKHSDYCRVPGGKSWKHCRQTVFTRQSFAGTTANDPQVSKAGHFISDNTCREIDGQTTACADAPS
jgi:hypothetical protein